MNVRKQKVSPKTLSVLIGVLGFVVLAGGAYTFVLPQRDKASQLSKELASTRAQIATARALAAQKPKEALRVPDLFKLAKAMPDETDMTGIILQLQKTANEAKVEFDSIQPGSPEPGGSYTVQPVELTFAGNFYSLTNFLGRLRKLVRVRHGELDATGRLFAVDAINFGPGPDGFPAIAATVSMNAYVFGGSGRATLAEVPTSTEATTPEPETTSPVASGATD